MASLNQADLTGAYLTKADLRDAQLVESLLVATLLGEANLSGANLNKADLRKASLSKATLTNANLAKANLAEADLRECNLCNANLTQANLSTALVMGSTFQQATLTGACIQDWNINSTTQLDAVICDYVYLQERKQERRPSSGKFALGEFTKLFQKAVETVDLIFRNGIDWDVFTYSFKKVEIENQDAQLDVQSIEKKGDGVLVIRVSVSPALDKAKIHSDFMQGYEFAAKALEPQYHARLEDKDKEINRLFNLVNQQQEKLGELVNLIAKSGRKVSNYYLPYSQFAGGIVDANTADIQQIGGNINNAEREKFLD
jgi:uncharacterized protein YjbI with pentapeptide repeats